MANGKAKSGLQAGTTASSSAASQESAAQVFSKPCEGL